MGADRVSRVHTLAAASLLTLVASTTALPAQRPRELERHVVRVQGHPITVWSKHPGLPTRRSLVLVHGRTWSARPNFDLRVPDSRRNASLMDALVARGYSVYAIDLRGYGGTPRDSTGWLTPDRAERDVSVVLDSVFERERQGSGVRIRAGAQRPVLLGYSRGAQVAMLVAQRHPDKIAGLVLYGYPEPVPAATSGEQTPATPPRARTTAAAAGEDFISPAVTPPGVRDAYVRAATLTDSIRMDWRDEARFLELDPGRVRV
ncbi:MAG TPA: alpha/beta fold hydrolase, partial [Gemmatimonadaceae bacterium]|nr:alpha/beta fold hydrolase [Gemmatimonadaceae bacterium]